MKKILLSVLGIISLGLFNFGNCSSTDTYYTFEGAIKSSIGTSNKYYNFQYPLYQSVPFSTSNITIKLESATINGNSLGVGSGNASSDGLYLYSIKAFYIKSDGTDSSYSISSISSQSDTLVLNSSSYNSIVALGIVYKGVSGTFSCNSTNPCPVSLSYKITYDDNSSYNFNPTCGTLICNCEDQVSFCTSQLGSCMSNYQSCISDLANCGGSMTGSCQENTGDIQWSSLYINDIQHLSSENINITIPEEISWDYTGNEENFDLMIEGYNVDADYIEGIITTQNTIPTKDNFNQIISGLIPLFVPGLVVILFIYFVFRLLKKIF